MDYTIPPSSLIAVICCFVIPLIGGIVFTFFVPTSPESLLSFLHFKSLKKEAEDLQKYQYELVERGVLAEAKILSLRALGETRKLSGGPYKAHVQYEVEVMPEGRPVFQTTFLHWLPISWKNGTGEAVREEAEKRIWVAYDPNDPSQIVISHYEKDHAVASRMIEFNKITKGNEDLKRTGEPAEAVITLAEDLDLPYPAKKSRAMRLEFMVTPQSGADFQAEGHFLIGDMAVQKYSVGKRVFVRFDPQNPKWAVLDTERNKSLQ